MTDPTYYTKSICWYETSTSNAFRKKGPCQIDNDGMLRFSQLTHLTYSRLKGPIIIYPDGGLEFNSSISADGTLHRTDGPAQIRSTGERIYWVNGMWMPANEFFLKHGAL